MAKYLNLSGLSTFWNKFKAYVSTSVTSNSPSADKTVIGFTGDKITYGNIAIAESQVTGLTAALAGKMDTVSGATANHIAVISSSGSLVDSGVAVDDIKASYNDGTTTYKGAIDIEKAAGVTTLSIDDGTSHTVGALMPTPTASDNDKYAKFTSSGIVWGDAPSAPTGAKGAKGPTGANGVSCTHSWSGTTLTVASSSGSNAVNLKGDTGDKGPDGPKGPSGTNGTSCTHSWNGTTLTVASSSGSNSVNLKGDTGPTGPDGDKGDTGKAGTGFTHSWNGTTLTVTSASAASSANLKGDTGDKGGRGDGGTSCTHSWNGYTLSVTSKSGTSSAALRGDTGNKGATGDTGTSCTHSVSGTTLSVTSSSGTSSINMKGDTGSKGPTGKSGWAAAVQGVTASSSSTSTTPAVSVTRSGTGLRPSLGFTFSGLKGLTGDTGPSGCSGLFTWWYAVKSSWTPTSTLPTSTSDSTNRFDYWTGNANRLIYASYEIYNNSGTDEYLKLTRREVISGTNYDYDLNIYIQKYSSFVYHTAICTGNWTGFYLTKLGSDTPQSTGVSLSYYIVTK